MERTDLISFSAVEFVEYDEKLYKELVERGCTAVVGGREKHVSTDLHELGQL